MDFLHGDKNSPLSTVILCQHWKLVFSFGDVNKEGETRSVFGYYIQVKKMKKFTQDGDCLFVNYANSHNSTCKFEWNSSSYL